MADGGPTHGALGVEIMSNSSSSSLSGGFFERALRRSTPYQDCLVPTRLQFTMGEDTCSKALSGLCSVCRAFPATSSLTVTRNILIHGVATTLQDDAVSTERVAWIRASTRGQFASVSASHATQTAFNYYIFQRDAVVEMGLTRFTVSELSQVMRLWGVLVICSFLILATVCGIQFSECQLCDHENFAENIFWCTATLAWMALMACCAPTSKHLSKLSYTQETSMGGAQNVGRVFGRVAMADDASFMVDPQDSAPDNFIRAGVHPDLIAQGKVATKTGE
ncbi:hypothetical protein Efla_005776 [Eimeria flavescens]